MKRSRTKQQLMEELNDARRRLAEFEAREPEHRRVGEVLRAAQARLQNLILSSPAVIYVCKPGGDFPTTFISENLTLQLGYETSEFIDDPAFYADRIHPEDKLRVFAGLPRLFEVGDYVHEYRFLHKNGTYCWMRDECRLIRDGDGKPSEVVGFWIDITERKRMEEALRESEATARALLDAPHEVGLLLDPDGIILDANEVAALRLNKRKNELIGLCVWDLLEPEAANRRKAFFVRAVHSGEPIQYEHEREGKWLDCFNYPIRDSRGRVSRVAVFARDITERKLAEARLVEYQEQLRSLASELSLTEERARRRLATDLHDSISQTLAMCKLKLDELQSRASPAALANDLDHISALLARAIQDTRSLTFELSPPVLYELGIEAALESLVEKMQQVNGIPIKLSEHGGSKPLSEDTAALCFRAVQELLVNAVKHAQARNIEVSTGRERGRIRITVVDDGIGFDTSGGISRREGKGGFGLFSIRERLQNLGGSLKVDSKPGRGTRVILTAPLKDRPFKKR